MVRATVSKNGNNRLHIEIPRLYIDKFPAGTVVSVKPLNEVNKDENE